MANIHSLGTWAVDISQARQRGSHSLIHEVLSPRKKGLFGYPISIYVTAAKGSSNPYPPLLLLQICRHCHQGLLYTHLGGQCHLPQPVSQQAAPHPISPWRLHCLHWGNQPLRPRLAEVFPRCRGSLWTEYSTGSMWILTISHQQEGTQGIHQRYRQTCCLFNQLRPYATRRNSSQT